MQLTLHRIQSTHRYTCIYIYIYVNTHVFKASNNQCDDLKRNKGQRTSTPELGQRAFCTWSCSTNMPSPSSKKHTHRKRQGNVGCASAAGKQSYHSHRFCSWHRIVLIMSGYCPTVRQQLDKCIIPAVAMDSNLLSRSNLCRHSNLFRHVESR